MVLSITKKNHSPIYFGRSSFLIELEIESKLDLGLILDGYGFAIGDDPSSAYGQMYFTLTNSSSNNK
jgi:hypothetical protein